ncbi:hypothetical protein BMS3Bbin07_01018 [bacterium BMS3Bbin07]|nr:hypothetical protein BMS3Bbin07_01018 [bacterium BMS3Bbin07]HDH01535.1 hypothetical protein [Nitrospirota bacterium]
MSRKTVIILLLLLSIPLAIYLLMPSDAKRIRKLVGEGREAAIQKDLSRVMSLVSYNYRDRYGFSYLYLKETLKRIFKDYDSIEIDLKRLRVDLDSEDGKAKAKFLLKAVGIKNNDREYILGTEEVYESVFLTLKKERMKWRVVETYLPTREGLIF